MHVLSRRQKPRKNKRRASYIERLEERVLLTAAQEEQHLTYLINRARHDPERFTADYGLAESLSDVAHRAPLATNVTLETVAATRASELAAQGFLSHQNPATGNWPNQVLREQGYAIPAAWPENANFVETVSAGTNDSDAFATFQRMLFGNNESDASLQHLLGVGQAFTGGNEIGVGFVKDGSSLFENYWAVEIAERPAASPFLTGVVYNDQNENLRFDAGEGLPGVTILAGAQSTTTNEAGGWTIPATPGRYRVRAEGGGFTGVSEATAHVSDRNVEIDFISSRPAGVVSFATRHNARLPADATGNGTVNNEDALSLVSMIRNMAAGSLPDARIDSSEPLYPDVNGDQWFTNIDVLLSISHLRRHGPSSLPAVAAGSFDAREASPPTPAPSSAASPQQITSPSSQEILVNSLIPRIQTSEAESSAVTMNSSGNTVVAFSGRGPVDRDGVFARRYGADGEPVGDSFRVNTTTREAQTAPSVAMDEEGNFVVAWEGRGPGDQKGIFAQWFDAAGNAVGRETLVNSTRGGEQRHVAVGMAAGGHSIAVWQGVGAGDFDGIFLQRFDENRNPIGGETLVNTTTVNAQAFPAVSVNSGGEILVTWSSRHQDGSDWGVYAQRLSANGERMGGEFQINQEGTSSELQSSVGMDDTGNAVYVWSGFDGESWDVYSRRFDENNAPMGIQHLVNSTVLGHQRDARVAMTRGGSYAVTWTSGLPNGAGWEVFAKTYDNAGESHNEFQVNTITLGRNSGHQQFSAIAVGNGPSAFIAWSGRGALDRDGVFRRPVEDPALIDCEFGEEFTNLTIAEGGGTFLGHGDVAIENCTALLTEGDSFLVGLEMDFVVPDVSTAIEFTFSDLEFDRTASGFHKDAFEVALVDRDGNPLVQNFLPGRDAFINYTEGEPPLFREGVQVNGNTVLVGLNGVLPGTEGTLIFRLVNNDADTGTSVRIEEVKLVSSSLKAENPEGVFDAMQLLQTAEREVPQAVVSDRGIASSRNTSPDSPTISIAAEAPLDSLPVGSEVVVSGQAHQTDLEYVTVNGLPVEVLDGAGRFFSKVIVESGDTGLLFKAHYLGGRTVSTSLNLVGTDSQSAEFDFSQFTDITADFEDIYGTTSFFDDDNTLFVDLALRNAGAFPAETPLLVGVTNVSASSVTVLDVDGLTPEGVPFYNFSRHTAGGRLAPNETTESPPIAFYNPEQVQFTYDLVFFGKLNQRAYITSLPKVETSPGRNYSYDLNAVDPENDPLAFSLISAPNGMTINEDSGEISWQPTTDAFGSHEVAVLVEDNQGNGTQQQFTLQVVPTPPNRPPVITSTPVTEAQVSSGFFGEEVPVTLEAWQTVRLSTDIDRAPNWEIDPEGTSVKQQANADASIFLSDFDLTNSRIRGRWKVEDTGAGALGGEIDDDFMGFVFGYQDSGHFYLFDWKQASQEPGGLQGMSVKVVNADAPLAVADLWPTNGNGERVRTLYHNDIAWTNFVEYSFELEFNQGNFKIEVAEGDTVLDTIEIVDDTYTAGGFGFYNYSQGEVVYQEFTQAQAAEFTYEYDVDAIDPDDDSIQYSLTIAPDGMTVNENSGVISWGPNAQQIGNHDVTVQASDGRGGVDEQSFVVCVHPDPENHPPVIISDPITTVTVRSENQAAQNVDFRTWTQMNFPVTGQPDDPVWEVSESVATQLLNSEPSALISDFEISNHEVTGVLRIDTARDDDSFGLVFGFQDVENHYRFSWSNQTKQPRSSGIPFFGVGVAVTGGGETLYSNRTPGIEWREITDYDFTLRFQPGNIFLEVRDGQSIVDSVTIEDDTFTSGKIGLYSASQPRSQFKNFQVRPLSGFDYTYDVDAVDPDNDILSYSLSDAPEGMTIDPETGLIEWQADEIPGIDETFFGEDLNNTDDPNTTDDDPIRLPETPNLVTARDEFLSKLRSVSTEDFEGFADGVVPSTLTLGSETVTVSGAPSIIDLPTSTFSGAYPNSGDKFLFHFGPAGSFELEFSNAQAAFGFSATDVGEVAQLILTLHHLDGETTDLNVPHTVFPENTGGALFFGVIDTARPFTKVTFTNTNSTQDGFGFDDLTIGRRDQVDFETDVTVLVSDRRGGFDTQSFTIETQLAADGEIRGVKFADEDGNGTRDPSTEPGIEDWTIYLDQNNNGVRDTGERFATTDAEGIYAFINLPAGTYTVREELQPGFRQTLPAQTGQAGEGAYTITLENDETVTDIDFGNVEVQGTLNNPPEVTTTPVTSTLPRSLYRYNAGAVDAENDPLSFSLPLGPSGMTVHPRLGTVIWTPSHEQVGVHQVLLRVQDDRGEVDVQSYEVTVSAENVAPLFPSPAPIEAYVNRPFHFDVGVQDADGDELTVELVNAPSGMTLRSTEIHDSNGGVIDTLYHLEWTPNAAGEHPVTLSVSDGKGGEASQSFIVAVSERSGNEPPQVLSTPKTVAQVGNLYAYLIEAVDADNDPVSISLQASPPGMTINETGLITWTPAGLQLGTHPVEVLVSDGQGGNEVERFDVSVLAQVENLSPVITSTPSPGAALNTVYEYAIKAIDPDRDPLRYELVAGPRGMSIEGGALRWMPDEFQLGSHTVVVDASDPSLLSARQTFTVTVRCNNTHPLILSVPPTRGFSNEPYVYPVRATDLEDNPLRFSLTTAPTGMTIDEVTGVLRWTPIGADIGEHDVKIRVEDDFGGANTQQYTLVVGSASLPIDPTDPESPAAGNRPPVIVSAPQFGGEAGVLYQYQVGALDPLGLASFLGGCRFKVVDFFF